MKRALPLLLVILSTTMFGASPGHVKDLGFLAGMWSTTVDGELWEEQWMLPSKDSVVGVCRAMTGGKTTFYEILTVEQDGDRAVLRMKHFNRGLVGWEEKDKAVELPLVSVRGKEAVFAKSDGSLRLVYTLTADDELVAVLDRVKNGKPTKTEFRYGRIKN